jgi:hypothetical protein
MPLGAAIVGAPVAPDGVVVAGMLGPNEMPTASSSDDCLGEGNAIDAPLKKFGFGDGVFKLVIRRWSGFESSDVRPRMPGSSGEIRLNCPFLLPYLLFTLLLPKRVHFDSTTQSKVYYHSSPQRIRLNIRYSFKLWRRSNFVTFDRLTLFKRLIYPRLLNVDEGNMNIGGPLSYYEIFAMKRVQESI